MGQRGSIAVVSDDAGWTQSVRAALRERGVGSLPLLEVTFGDRDGLSALLLDSRLEPYGGIELGEQLRLVLADVCPPLLLSAPDPEALTDEERAPFFAVVRAADPAIVADAAARELSRLPATSGYVLRSGLVRARSGSD